MEVEELTREAIRDAAQVLVDDGCGWWSRLDDAADTYKNKVAENGRPRDIYWVHQDDCAVVSEPKKVCLCKLGRLNGSLLRVNPAAA